jgi:trans-o-hydroxybenzylidenepyruvate hydratase-aldolase
MISASDLHGVMAMMPAFTTEDGDDYRATNTINVDELKRAVDQAIKDGVNVISTTGSFGECHTLLPDEFETLTHATVEAVNKRIPLFIGCTSTHTRETMRKMAIARDAGAAGVLIGVPYYFPSTVDNAVQFFHDCAAEFPTLGIMIYHNPTFHHITLPVDAFKRITQDANVVAMKDSHRTPFEFMRLQKIVKGKISVMVNTLQAYPYMTMGAPGFWSFDLWMGPWAILRLRDAMETGDLDRGQEIMFDIAGAGAGGPQNLSWRETLAKVAMRQAGYCDPGPLRPPFVNVPDDVKAKAEQLAQNWKALSERYQPVRATA